MLITPPPVFTLMNPTPPADPKTQATFLAAANAPNMNLICVLHMNDVLAGNFAALDYIFSVLRPNGLFRINMLGMPVDPNTTKYRTTSLITSYVGSAPAPLPQPVIWDAGFSDPVQGDFPKCFVQAVAYIQSKGLMAQFHGFGFCPCGPSNLDGEFTIISSFTDANKVKHDYSTTLLSLGYTEQVVIQTLASIHTSVENAAPGLQHRFSWFTPIGQKLGYIKDPTASFAFTIWNAMLAAVPSSLLTPINQVMTGESTLGYTAMERSASNGRLDLQCDTPFNTYDEMVTVTLNCLSYEPDWYEIHPIQAVFVGTFLASNPVLDVPTRPLDKSLQQTSSYILLSNGSSRLAKMDGSGFIIKES